MKDNTALIIYVGRKHLKHNQIILDLESENLTVSEFDLPKNDIDSCSINDKLSREIKIIELLIVYLSKETKNHACINKSVELANAYGKRIVGIWIDDAEPEDLCGSVGAYGDSITPYDINSKNIFCGQSDVWVNPDYSNPTKTKIKKHTCG